MSARAAAERRRARLALWCRAALEVSAGVGYASFLLVEARLEGGLEGARALLRWACVAAIVLLPLFPASLERVLERRAGARARRFPWALALQALPLALLARGEPVQLGLGALALLQGNLLVRGSNDALAAWSLALGPLQVACGMALAPAAEWLLLFPLSLIASGAAASLLRARALERDVELRAPRVLLRGAEAAAPAVAREWPRRVIASLWPSLALLAAIPLAHGLVIGTRAALFGSLRVAERAEEERESEARARADLSAVRTQGEGETVRSFPSSLFYGGDIAQLAGDAVMEIVPSRPGGLPLARRPRALYLRGLVLDRFGSSTAEFAGGLQPLVYRAGDDGWARLASRPVADELELDILLEPFFIGDAWSNVLFSPQPASAVERERVLFHPDDRLMLPVAPQETIRYRVRAPFPGGADAPRARGRAAHPDARYLELPPPSEELAWIRERAHEATRGARDDAQRVQRLMEHFRREYAYALESPGIPGLAGVVDFLRRREGHCTYFAVAAALMLRSLGLPARVATGYLASDWSEEDGRFRVTTRNGHAWIEVAFEGEGWVSFDPTPPDRRAAALAAADADPGRGLVSWLGELRDHAFFWAASGGHDAYFRSFARVLADGPRALATTLAHQPGWLALFALALVLLWARRRSRARNDATELAAQAGASTSAELGALLTALARAGVPRRSSQTLRELADEAARLDVPEIASLPRLARALQRARYGAAPLSDEERRSIDALVQALALD